MILEKFDNAQKLKQGKTAKKNEGEINKTSNLITAVNYLRSYIVVKNVTNATQNSK